MTIDGRRAGRLVLLLTWTCASNGAQTADGQATGDLREVLEQFRRVSAIHFFASVEIVLKYVPCDNCPDVQPTGLPISGTVEYWATGDRYRLNSWAEPHSYPGVQTQVAYDGRRYQLLRSDGTLSYSSEDSDRLLPTLPNPLLELLQFRYPITDANYQSDLRLKDVRRDAIPADLLASSWTAVEEGERRLERTRLPGGTYEGQAYFYYVYVSPGRRSAPLRIDRVGEGGRLTSAEFSDYVERASSRGPTYWPKRIVLRAFDAGGSATVTMSFQLTEFSVDTPLPREIFVIRPDSAARVWDEQRREFTRPE